ncbi:serine/arginine repetitive matrix protein 2-like [Colias croceus]|uniref:serine/arginine repetitive matrix protein 2-like n=1 Tax=Colias crocea TaxID=72248 RepID=UPI001E2814D9|nr:serine/arginine repetitive matrix protein 2-like [Colias croceus]
MSGGRLVVLDRAGRDVKQYPLSEGLATLGTDPACDIRVMLPTVSPHHATVVVHANQTVVQSVSEGETLVNGAAVSVAALRHGDVISLGGRHLRWEYADPGRRRPGTHSAQPALCRAGRGRSRRVRPSEPTATNVIVHSHRASMPASTSMKQVAIVQPQRRETGSNNGDKTPQNWTPANSDLSSAHSTPEPTRKSTRPSPKSPQASTTKASQWIELRKSTRASLTPARTRNSPAALTPTRARTTNSNFDTSVTPRPQSSRASITPKQSSRASITPKPQSARASITPARTRATITQIDSSQETITPQSARSSLTQSNKRETITPRRATLTPQNRSVRSRPLLTPQNRSVRNTRPSLTPIQSRSLRVTRPSLTTSRANERKDTSLRLTVLRKTHNRPVKIEAPTSIDHTKQAAIMLMTRHTKSKSPNTSKVSIVVTKPTPVRKTPRSSRGSNIVITPKRSSNYSQGSRKSANRNSSVSVLEINDSDVSTQRRSSSRRSKASISERSPPLPSPKKSALKNPKNHNRKTESIKFDLSNLENETRQSDIVTIDTTNMSNESVSDVSLHYSDTSLSSPSPRRSIHSRSSRIIENAVGSPMNQSIEQNDETITPESPRSRNSSRSSLIMQKALEQSNVSRLSRRFTKTVSEQSWSTTVANQTKTLSPRTSNVESYSIVDLVSVDSNGVSEYNSVASTPTFGTPRSSSRISKSIDPTMTSSTPYNRAPPTKTPLSDSKASVQSASMITPENDENFRPFNSTRKSRASRSRSRINDSDLLLLDDDDSPRTSRRTSKTTASPFVPKSLSVNISSNQDGTITPENEPNNEECTTPVLSIQSLLDSSQGSIASQSYSKKGIKINVKRKTIGVIRSRRKQSDVKSKSFTIRRTARRNQDESGIVTPTSAFIPEPEGVKNKHSTAKKPLSKRSIIDNLNDSDIVKQLFNSPVKRKLSQSMTEFSRHQLFDDDYDIPRKQTRQTTALTGRTPDNSIMNQTQNVTADVFVSPLTTPSSSPNLEGIKRLFAKNTPENDLRNVRGVKGLLRTPRNRRSVKNDLTNVSGVKATFAKAPRNSLSDVRIKELFMQSPRNDLRRVSAVKTVFKSTRKQRSPKNTLEDVGGIKNLFKSSPRNDLRNASGVKDALQIRSPKNDLTDVRGVKRMFRLEKQKYQSDVSGIEQLFHESNLDTTFDLLMGKPPLRTYTKAASGQKPKPKVNTRKAKSLHDSIELITTNVEEWLENQKPKQLQVYSEHTLPIKKRSLVNKSNNESKARLPIKKRVVHSTPMKGQNATMNASELGRVSPIALLADATAGTSQMAEATTVVAQPEPKKRRTKANNTKIESPKNLSPRKARGSKLQALSKIKKEPKSKIVKEKITKQTNIQDTEVENVQPSPTKETPETKLPPRRTRGKAKLTPVKAKASKARQSIPNTINRRQSLVITKKAPIAKPQKQTRNSTKQDLDAVEPTTTRRQKSKVTVVIPKPSPVRRTRRKADEVVIEEKPKRGRKVVEIVEEKPKRGKKVQIEEPKEAKNAKTNKTQELPEVETTKRTRRGAKVEEIEIPKRGKKQPESEVNETVEPVKRGRKNVQIEAIIEEKPKRGRAANKSNVTEKKINKKAEETDVKAEETVVEPKRSRRNNTTVIPAVENVKPKGKMLVKSQSADEVQPKRTRRNQANKSEEKIEEPVVKRPTRGKKAQAESVPPTEGRKRKTIASPAKETGGRAKKLKVTVNSPAKRQTRNKVVQDSQQNTRTRRRGVCS